MYIDKVFAYCNFCFVQHWLPPNKICFKGNNYVGGQWIIKEDIRSPNQIKWASFIFRNFFVLSSLIASFEPSHVLAVQRNTYWGGSGFDTTPAPPPSAGFVFFSSVQHPQLIQLIHCHMGMEIRENNYTFWFCLNFCGINWTWWQAD